MIQPHELDNRDGMTPRQAHAVALVEEYRAVAHEPPSYAWLARRLNVSRTAAYNLITRAKADERAGRAR